MDNYQGPVRVGIVGCGYQDCLLAEAISRTGSLRVTACADGDSINLLFHLGRRIEGHRILALGAYRPTDVAHGWPTSPSHAEPGLGTHPNRTPGLSSATGAAGETGGERARHPLQAVVNEFKRIFGDMEVDLLQAEGGSLSRRSWIASPTSWVTPFARPSTNTRQECLSSRSSCCAACKSEEV